MALEDLISQYVSETILPAGAIGLAGFLVRGAKALESDANPRALKYVADLLTEGDLKNIGKAGAGLVPFLFDKVFGPRPFSFRFISRSIIATTIFWLILLELKHVNWVIQTAFIYESWTIVIFLLPIWYAIDWVSLLKAKFLIKLISQHYAVITSVFFLFVDMALSYLIWYIFSFIFVVIMTLVSGFPDKISLVDIFKELSYGALTLKPFTKYLSYPSDEIRLNDVVMPSTILTSVWSLLLFVSCLIAQLLVPIDYLRRFTTWWFKDVEHHPLTAIAKVTATVIVIGAVVIKAMRWIY